MLDLVLQILEIQLVSWYRVLVGTRYTDAIKICRLLVLTDIQIISRLDAETPVIGVATMSKCMLSLIMIATPPCPLGSRLWLSLSHLAIL